MNEIRHIRTSLDLSQAEMAERLGVSQSTLSRLETGEIKLNKRTLLAARTLMPPKLRKSAASLSASKGAQKDSVKARAGATA